VTLSGAPSYTVASPPCSWHLWRWASKSGTFEPKAGTQAKLGQLQRDGRLFKLDCEFE